MLKYFLIVLVILFLVALVGCASQSAVLDITKTYNITSDICSLDVEINVADFVFVQGEKFSVESNLKNLSVLEEDGVLKIVEKTKFAHSYRDAKLKLCVPEGTVFESVSIKAGAGRLTAKALSANNMVLKTGAGQVEFDFLEVLEEIKLQGGAGEVIVKDGTLNNLSLDLGAGHLNMTANLIGESELKFGVGESDITILGNREDYSFDIRNGVGKININGVTVSGFVGSGIGENTVRIKGGVGSTNIGFQE